MQFGRQFLLHFFEKKFDGKNPKETRNKETRKNESKKKAIELLKIMIIYGIDTLPSLYFNSVPSASKYFHTRRVLSTFTNINYQTFWPTNFGHWILERSRKSESYKVSKYVRDKFRTYNFWTTRTFPRLKTFEICVI